MNKLVKESINERSDEDKINLFLRKNSSKIRDEWEKKIIKIFKEYLPFENKEDDVYDCQAIWWNKIVEPGWIAPTLKNLENNKNISLWDTEIVGEFEEKIVEDIFNNLNLPHEIMQ